ncbi:MAG: hypothetical protein ACYCS2_05080, partial [Acidimicrobiales bacterium]
AVQASSYPLAILSILTAVVGAYYYLRLIFIMYSSPAGEAEAEAVAVELMITDVAVSTASGTTLVEEMDEVVVLAETEAGPPELQVPTSTALVLTLTGLFTVVFGLVPGTIVNFAHQATLLVH